MNPIHYFTHLLRSLSGKLGYCPKCIRQAFVTASSFWGLALVVYFLSPNTHFYLGILFMAIILSTLWLLHVAAFALRKIRSQAAYHQAVGIDTPRRTFLGTGGKAVATALVVSVPAACDFLPKTVVAKIVWCDCYFDSDCGFLFYCRYDVDCTWVPKGTSEGDEHGRPPCPGDSSAGSCDGLCKFLKLPYGTVSREVIAGVADQYFEAYVRAAKGMTRNGEVDRELLAKARSVKLPDDGHKVLTGAIFSALDLTAGWDFAVGLRDMEDPERPGVEGFFRGVPKGQVEIIEATRAGFVKTIRSGDKNAMLPPLQGFWESHPDFHPNHGGRCYPHGHNTYKTARECQEANLMKIATALATDEAKQAAQ